MLAIQLHAAVCVWVCLQHYRSIDTSWERSAVAAAGCLPALSAPSVITQLTRVMPNNSIVLKVVDICDLELSVVPELFAACREKGLRAIWVVNRVDCLPKHTDLNQSVFFSGFSNVYQAHLLTQRSMHQLGGHASTCTLGSNNANMHSHSRHNVDPRTGLGKFYALPS